MISKNNKRRKNISIKINIKLFKGLAMALSTNINMIVNLKFDCKRSLRVIRNLLHKTEQKYQNISKREILFAF